MWVILNCSDLCLVLKKLKCLLLKHCIVEIGSVITRSIIIFLGDSNVKETACC